MPFPVPNVIQAHAGDIRKVPERNWNHIVMKVRNLGAQQLLVVWPLLDANLFNHTQNASAQLLDVFVLSMEWAEVPYGHLCEMRDFMAGHAAQHCAAAKLVVLQDFGAAYNAFHQMGVPHLPPAALSHYLHAISLNAGHLESPLPYGQKVVRALWKSQTAKEDVAALAVQKDWRQYLTASHIADADGNVLNGWEIAAYGEYQSLMKSWAGQLNCQPMQIEIWLETNADSLDVMPACDVELLTSVLGMLEI